MLNLWMTGSKLKSRGSPITRGLFRVIELILRNILHKWTSLATKPSIYFNKLWWTQFSSNIYTVNRISIGHSILTKLIIINLHYWFKIGQLITKTDDSYICQQLMIHNKNSKKHDKYSSGTCKGPSEQRILKVDSKSEKQLAYQPNHWRLKDSNF